MSQVYQRVMSDGDWELDLRPDTPRAVLDKLIPFTTHVVICPGEVDVTSSDSVFLAAARYVGVIRRLGRNRLQPGGPHICSWLSDPDGKGEVITSKLSLSASATLTNWVNQLTDSASIDVGTVTDPGTTYGNTYQWVSRRQILTSVCNAYGVEWRVENDFTVDVGTVGALYRSVAAGDTPAAIVARGIGGRDSNIIGIRSVVETSVDYEDYVSEVYVIGNGVGNHGGPSPFRKPRSGGVFTWRRIVVDPTSPLGSLDAVAESVYDLLPHEEQGRRELRVQTDVFDPGGDVTLGDDVYVWDPENGIVDTDNKVHYRGEVLYPQALRCVGMRWPVRRGMGVYLRTQNSSGTPTYENITPYVEYSEGAAELELGGASRLLRVDSAGQLVEVSGQAKTIPWLEYTPSITGTGTAVGNGTVTGTYRRDGTELHVSILWVLGSTSTVGSGGVIFSLPSGMVATGTSNKLWEVGGVLTDTGTNFIDGSGLVQGGTSTILVRYTNTAAATPVLTALSATTPFTWTTSDVININGTIEVDP